MFYYIFKLNHCTSLFKGPGGELLYYICEKKLYSLKTFCGSRGSCVKSDTLPHVMSPETVLVGAEDYKFDNKKKSGSVRLSAPTSERRRIK